MPESVPDAAQKASGDCSDTPSTPTGNRVGSTDRLVNEAPADACAHARAWGLAPLIAGQPIYRAGRWRRGRFGYAGSNNAWQITDDAPRRPAAVLVHDVDGSVRTLCLDLDTSKAHQAVVEADAFGLGRLLTGAGLEFVEDHSPSGGRHLYVPLQEPIPAAQARDLVEALAERTVSLDPGPHQNVTTGCIRVPGSVHKRGGYQMLITPLDRARAILHRRNPGRALEALRAELAPELHLVRQKHQKLRTRQKSRQQAPAPDGAARAVPPPTAAAQRAQESSPLRAIACTGLYDTQRYPSASEARMAVLNHFAGCGWTLEQVRAEMAGSCAGLAALYGAKADRLLTHEWDKAVTYVQAKEAAKKETKEPTEETTGGPGLTPAHNFITSHTHLTAGATETPSVRVLHQLVNDLENVLYGVLDLRWNQEGRAGIGLRFLFRAVLAYMRTNRTDLLDVGCRTFATALGKDVGTISRLLRRLEKVSGGILTRIERGRGHRADIYRIQLPEEFEQLARTMTWRKGKIHAVRPVFRVLGDVSALAYEAIERGRHPPTTSEMARTTGISRRALIDHLTRMESLRMIRRHEGSWAIVASTNLPDLAERLGATQDRQEQIALYRRQRARWHAWLARHSAPELAEYELHDPEVEAYWLPPTDDPRQLQLQIWHAA